MRKSLPADGTPHRRWYFFEGACLSLLGRRIGARGRLFQGARPALAGDDAALGIEIEKDVVLAASSTRYAESEMPIRRKGISLSRQIARSRQRPCRRRQHTASILQGILELIRLAYSKPAQRRGRDLHEAGLQCSGQDI